MPRSSIVDEIATHRGLASLPRVWVEYAHGWISEQDALHGADEPEELAARSARMLRPPTTDRSRVLLRSLLDEHLAAEHPSASWSGRWIVGVVTAAAAAVLLLVNPRAGTGLPAFEAGYELELRRGLVLERDAEPREPADVEVPRYRLDHPVELVLRPAHRVTEAVQVRVFARRDDGREQVVPVEASVGSRGVVEILGVPRAWGLPPGRWQLTVVVGPAAGLPRTRVQVQTDERAPYDVQQAWIEILQEAPKPD